MAAPPSASPKPLDARADGGHETPTPACAFPHPLITEVLYAVPSTGESDANKDGKREVSGDEFVELINPHDRPIDLRGYTIADSSPNVKSRIHFTFPAMTLPARGVVVVFNGHDSKIPGPLGDAKHAPTGTNDHFNKAAVFTMRIPSTRISFSNAGDAVCLSAPDGKALQRIRWGKADEKAGGTGFILDEIAPVTSKGSVQRDGMSKAAAWKAHADADAAPFSPGVFSFDTTATTPAATPHAPPPATPPPQPAATSPTNEPAPAPEPSDRPQRSARPRRPASSPTF